jgi:hypothetical protein
MRDPDRGVAHIMINIWFYSINLAVEVSTYADGDFDIDKIFVLDGEGQICEELPANMLTLQADREILTLVEQALEAQEPDCDGPDVPYYPEYRIGNVNC